MPKTSGVFKNVWVKNKVFWPKKQVGAASVWFRWRGRCAGLFEVNRVLGDFPQGDFWKINPLAF